MAEDAAEIRGSKDPLSPSSLAMNKDDIQKHLNELDAIIRDAQDRKRPLRAELNAILRAEREAAAGVIREPSLKEYKAAHGLLTTEEARDLFWDAGISISNMNISKACADGWIPAVRFRGKSSLPWLLSPADVAERIQSVIESGFDDWDEYLRYFTRKR